MKYLVKVLGSINEDWFVAFQTDDIVEAYNNMQAYKHTHDVCVVDIEDTRTGAEYEDIITAAKQVKMEELLDDDYEYENWLNDTYSTSYILKELKGGRSVASILEEIEEDWITNCQYLLDMEDEKDLLKDYAY